MLSNSTVQYLAIRYTEIVFSCEYRHANYVYYTGMSAVQTANEMWRLRLLPNPIPSQKEPGSAKSGYQ